MHTMGSMKAEVLRWTRESVDDGILADAINDAIEDLWESIILIHLSSFFQGPVNVTFAAAAERAEVVSIADPTAAPTVATVADANAPTSARNYQVAYTYVTESGSSTLVSPDAAVNPASGFLAQVGPAPFVEGAIGYDVYAGTVTGRKAKQNDEPVPFTDLFTEPVDGFFDEPDMPSPPVVNNTADDVFYIRHVELLTPDSTFKPYRQADMDSELMRRVGHTMASTSQFQNYYFDFVNQRTFELRPAAGTEITPRYFFIRKPRRIRFDSSTMPFTSIPHIAFIRYFALSLAFLSFHEYAASTAWGIKSAGKKVSILQAVNQMNWAKDTYVLPYIMG